MSATTSGSGDMDAHTKHNTRQKSLPRWKQRFLREMIRYFISVLYLAAFFGAFAWYRRFVLAAYKINYFNYGVALIEALILAKVIWIGEVLHIVRDREDKPLIYPTIEKAVVFTIFVGIFEVIERMIGGLIEGIGAKAGVMKLLAEGKYEWLARCIVVFCAFIPFFAFRELAREMGEGKLWRIFFKRKEEPSEFGMPGAPA
jgi:hypothetical protein